MLDRVVGNIGRKPLKVLVQVNTSGEECKNLRISNFFFASNSNVSISTFLYMTAKFGVEPCGCVGLAKHVKEACSNLEFSGLMTIGMADYTSTPENFKVYIILMESKETFGNIMGTLTKKKLSFVSYYICRCLRNAEVKCVRRWEYLRSSASCRWGCLVTLS